MTKKNNPLVPGTVSKILWHFTGGPLWDSTLNRQLNRPKPASKAYKALVSIVKSSELRVGKYEEVVKVNVPLIRRRDAATNELIVLASKDITISSAPVCCVADIPIMHLGYHGQRYGKFAIGFHRDALIRQGFNSVLYVLHDSETLNMIHDSLVMVGEPVLDNLKSDESELYDKLTKQANEGVSVEELLPEIMRHIDVQSTLWTLTEIKDRFSKFLSFVKTFDAGEFNSIYCEREWRSVRPFKFNYNNIAMIVAPRLGGYHSRLIKEFKKFPLPDSIPVVAWEDLLEY